MPQAGGTVAEEHSDADLPVLGRAEQAARLRHWSVAGEPVLAGIGCVVASVYVLQAEDRRWWWLAVPLQIFMVVNLARQVARPQSVSWLCPVLRGLAVVAMFAVAAGACPPYRADVMPWLSYGSVLYGVVLGLRRSIPVQALALPAYFVVAVDVYDPWNAGTRTLAAALAAVLGGALGDAVDRSLEAARLERGRAERHRLREAQLRTLLEAAPVGVVVYEDGGYRSFANPRAADLVNTTVEDLLEQGLRVHIHDDDVSAYDEALKAGVEGVAEPRRVRTRQESGGRTLDVTVVPVTDPDGNSVGGVRIVVDRTDDVARERWLSRFVAMAEATSDLVGLLGVDGQPMYLNPAGRALAGLAPDAPITEWDPFAALTGTTSTLLAGEVRETLSRGERWHGELELAPAGSGAVRAFSGVMVGIRDAGGEIDAVGFVLRDLTDRKHLEESLARAARHDSLTGLPNRQGLFEVLDERLRCGRHTTVLFLDLDDFKVVNDSQGHVIGDRVLRVVASRLRHKIRNRDVVGRLGGDEFLVICDELSSQELDQFAHRLLGALRQPIVLDQSKHVVSASVGVATWRGQELTAQELIQQADIAMYRAKGAGRRQVVEFDEAMRIELIERSELERDLLSALERDEFVMHYQPVCRLSDGYVTAFEALLRWDHPTKGRLGPDAFLPTALAAGLGRELVDVVLDKALDGLQQLQRVRPHVRLSVNVAPSQLMLSDLANRLADAACRRGVSPRSLILEVTEQALVDDLEVARRMLGDLHHLGVELAIDDFGTGYSSLAMLHHLSVDYLKIDRSFVNELGHSTGASRIVRLVLALAEELHLRAVAEGVERSEQVEELMNLGCCLGQGFWFAAPVPLEEALAIAHQGHSLPVVHALGAGEGHRSAAVAAWSAPTP